MGILRTTAFAVFAFLLLGNAEAQIGGLDQSFIPGPILNAEIRANVRAILVQSNGSVVVAGDFTSIGGVGRNRIARLTSSGALDNSFVHQGGANGPIYALALQSDGKILIGGDFTAYNGVSRNRIARINSDGSLDTSFNPGVGANGAVFTICRSNNYYYGSGDAILIGGNFTTVGGITRNRIAKLSANGTVDTSFNPGSGANDAVYAIVVSGSYYPEAIYAGGAFTTFDGQVRNRLVKIDSGGRLDYLFNSGTGLNGDVYALAMAGDTFSSSAALYAGGNFTSVDGIVRGRIARFSTSWYGFGSVLDQNFNAWVDAPIRAFFTDSPSYFSESQVLIAGDFNIVNGVSKNRLARLLVNNDMYRYGPYGSSATVNIDSAFNPAPGINESVFAVAKLSDGRSFVGGNFSSVSGNSTYGLARLYGDFGSQLPSAPQSIIVSPASSTQMVLEWGSASNSSNYKIERSLDGATNWSQVGSSSSPYVDDGLSAGSTYYYRVKANNYNGDGEYSPIGSATTDASSWFGPGALDASTGPNSGPSGTVDKFVMQADGKIILVGSFSQVDGAARKYIARLNADWTLDASFDPGTGPNSSIQAVAIQSDGKILIGGYFSTVSGFDRQYIARLNSNGTLDTTFDSGIGPSSSVEAISVQSDGKILVGGWFSTYSGYSQNYLARLNPDGSLDMGYRTTPNSIVKDIAIQSDGRAIIGGSFSNVNGISKNGVARINPDGTLDSSFNSGSGSNSVEDVFVQSDGKILICGGFSTFGGVARKYIARLEVSGELDTTFDPGTGPNNSLTSVCADAQGKVVIAGHFTKVSGAFCFRIARLNQDGSLDVTFRTGVGMNGVVNSLMIQPDAKIIAGGGFTTVAGSPVRYLARLNGGENGQLMITSPSPMVKGTAGVIYSQSFAASGGNPPYSWSITAGALPPGLDLSTSGVLYGNPTKTISTAFLLRVTDANLQFTERLFNLSTFDVPSGLLILEATYGANGTTVNVKNHIESRIVNNSVNMTASNDNLGGDPVSGKVKTLYVRYQDSTGHYETNVQEGGTLILPNTSHRRLPMQFAQWASTKFSSGELSDQNISGYYSDPDGDGISNILESAFGGNPKVSDSVENSPFLDLVGDRIQITFICDSTRTNLNYIVEASNNLVSWTEIARSVGGTKTLPVSNLSTISDSAGPEGLRYVTVTDNTDFSASGKSFLRVKVNNP
jgi:uncharacterized delta-60 repeat protein